VVWRTIARPPLHLQRELMIKAAGSSVHQNSTTVSVGALHQACRICRTTYIGLVCPTCALNGLTEPLPSPVERNRYRAAMPAVAGMVCALAASYLYTSWGRRVRPRFQR
jgi:hypothetical protein